MKEYKKIEEGVFEVRIVSEPDTITIQELQDEIKELEKQLQYEEPSKKELEDFGRMNHLFYMDQIIVQTKISELQSLINELEEIE